MRLVHVRASDHEEDILALLHCDARDAWDGLHAQLRDGLAALLLGAVLLALGAVGALLALEGWHVIVIVIGALLLGLFLDLGLVLNHLFDLWSFLDLGLVLN